MVFLFSAASIFSNQLIFTIISPILIYIMRVKHMDSFIALMISINIMIEFVSLAIGVALQLLGTFVSTEWAGFLLTMARLSIRSLSLCSGCATLIYALSL